MNHRFNILLFTFLFVIFNFLVIKPIKAIPLIGNIYGSLGGTLNNNYISGSVLGDIKNDFSNSISNNKSINLAAGIASNLPIPIIDSLRVQLNYVKSFNSSNNNLLGLGIYYDIKKLPIVTPYLGIAFFNYNSKLILSNREANIKQTLNQGLTSFHIGMDLSLPLFPLSVYSEYNYAIPGIFNNNFSFNKNGVKYDNKGFHLSMFTIGIRFYFL